MNRPARILLVEDEEITRAIIEEVLEPPAFVVTSCADGGGAWERLQADAEGYDVILLDRGLPDMDGLELLRRIKSSRGFARIPVVLETASDDEQSIRQGLREGAYYYLTKPFVADVLLAVVNAALIQARQWSEMIDSVRRAERPLALLQSGTFRFRDLEEARLLGSYLARACPEPERVVLGLQELLVNAVEHGNLGISYEEKGALLVAGGWLEEIARRLEKPEFRNRYVEVRFEREAHALRFTIEDQGEGFEWQRFMEFAPERAFDPHGRGIAMARALSFDRIEYSTRGNCVDATIRLPDDDNR